MDVYVLVCMYVCIETIPFVVVFCMSAHIEQKKHFLQLQCTVGMDFIFRKLGLFVRSNDGDDNDEKVESLDNIARKKRMEYDALLREQLSSFMRDPQRTLTPIERHEAEYMQYLKYREIMLCRVCVCQSSIFYILSFNIFCSNDDDGDDGSNNYYYLCVCIDCI